MSVIPRQKHICVAKSIVSRDEKRVGRGKMDTASEMNYVSHFESTESIPITRTYRGRYRLLFYGI